MADPHQSNVEVAAGARPAAAPARRPYGGPRTTPELARVPSWLATAAAWTWRVLVLLVGAGAVLWVLQRLALVTIPVILGLLLATLAVPAARWLEARGAPSLIAAVVVVGGGIAVVSGIVAALIPPFTRQLDALQPTVLEGVDRFFATIEASPLDYDRDQITELFRQLTQDAGGNGGEIAGQVASGLVVVGQTLTAVVLAVVLGFFFVKDGQAIVDWMIARTPDDYRDVSRAVGRRAWIALSGFTRSTLAIALLDATLIGVGLAIVGVPLVLPLAVLVFIGAFIPVIGAFVSGLVAVLVALAAGGPVQAGIVLAIVVGVQQIEGNILHPVLVRRSVALHPAVVLGALVAGGILGGIIGAFLAVPVAAVASSVGNELRLRHEATDGPVTDAGDDRPMGPPDNPVRPHEI